MDEVHDHGDPEVDLYWRARLMAGTPLTEATGEGMPGLVKKWMLENEEPESLRICNEILAAS
jgi:hypothetical protein